MREPLTKFSLILLPAAVVVLGMGHAQAASSLLCVAYAAIGKELVTHTGMRQLKLLPVIGATLGLFLDMEHGTSPWFTIAMVLAGSGTMVRQLFMQRLTLIGKRWLEPAILVAASSCYAMALWQTGFTWETVILPLVPLGGATGLAALYVVDGAILEIRTRFGYRIKVGQPAPPVELPDQQGELVKLSSYKGEHPVLLIFVRGDWCPGCHMLLRTYERNRQAFLRKGVHVLAIGPDSVEVNKEVVERLGVGYKLLSDPGQRVSAQFGVVYNNPMLEHGLDYEKGIPLPASFLVDQAGVVRYVSRPDRVGEFLNPELIFSVLEQLPDEAAVEWRMRA